MGGGGGQADRQGALQELSGKPFGGFLVRAVGIGLVGMTLWRLPEAVFGAAGPDGDKPVKRLSSAGRCVFYAVVASAVAGGFFVYAALRYDAAQAKGLDDTLRSFARTGAGPWLLVAVTSGLVLFGLFSWAMARRREV